jgi:hypothetical protein
MRFEKCQDLAIELVGAVHIRQMRGPGGVDRFGIGNLLRKDRQTLDDQQGRNLDLTYPR